MAHVKRRRWYLLVLAAGMVAGSGCSKKESAPTEEVDKAAGKPKIQAIQPEFDFGKVKQGEDVEHTFKLKNVGTKELVIEKTKGS